MMNYGEGANMCSQSSKGGRTWGGVSHLSNLIGGSCLHNIRWLTRVTPTTKSHFWWRQKFWRNMSTWDKQNSCWNKRKPMKSQWEWTLSNQRPQYRQRLPCKLHAFDLHLKRGEKKPDLVLWRWGVWTWWLLPGSTLTSHICLSPPMGIRGRISCVTAWPLEEVKYWGERLDDS